MSRNYRKEQENIQKKEIKEEILPLLPSFVSDFSDNLFARNRKSLTVFTYMKKLKIFFRYLEEGETSPFYQTKSNAISLKMLDNLTVIDIERFLGSLDISPKTRNGYISALNALFEYLYKRDLISHNVITKIDRATIKRYEREVVRLTDAQSIGFIDAVSTGVGLTKTQTAYYKKNGLRDKAICLILLRTGLRVSELVSLDIEDLNLNENNLSVVRKGNKVDTVYFDDDVKNSIIDYINIRNDLDKTSKTSPLFLSTYGKTKGERITVRQVEHLVKKYTSVGAKGTGTGLSPHKLRATFATQMLSETGNITLVQAQLAHENIQTTSIYIDSSSQDKKEARNILMKRDKEIRGMDLNPLEDKKAVIKKKD